MEEMGRFFCGALRLLLNEEAAFWAAEKIEEKNPPCGFVVELFAPGVFSSRGVSAEIEFDSLLGP